MQPITPGKSILTLIALITAIGPYAADWSETHVLNPRWPPHARFHNGQTMSTGLFIGLTTLYYLYASSPTYMQPERLNFTLLLFHMYYLSALSGCLYPGALFMDPEFGEGRPQLWAFSALLVVAWWGWGLERGRLRGGRGGKEREG